MALCFSILLGGSCIFLAYAIYKFNLVIQNPAVLAAWTWQQPVLFALCVVVITAMIIVILMSVVISIYVVRRVNEIAQTAHHIIETDDLSKRIEVTTSWDDLSFLAGGINKLLNRLELQIHGVRQVSDNIAHDLRTPLTRFRNHLEMNAGQEIGFDERQKLIDEADNLLNTFGTVLRISQLEAGGGAAKVSSLNLEEVMADVVELYGPVGEERDVEIVQKGHQQIRADKDLLFQLFANLVDNAIKFAPDKSTISIEIGGTLSFGKVTIADQGIGLSYDEMKRVTERFYRADHSRNTKGNGLGLTMAKAIIDYHEGSISFEDARPGLRVQVLLAK